MRYKVVLCAAIVATLACFPGCSKKTNQMQVKNSSGILETNKKTSGDTGDIFKEFYSDDTAGQAGSKKGSAKAASKSQTFSPTSTVSASPGEFVENGRYVVQVSCVRSKSLAEKVAATFKEKKFPAYIAEVQNPTPALTGTFYRIRIGAFSGLSSAKSFGDNTLVPAGNEYWVDKKSNDNTGMEGYGLGNGAAQVSPSPSPSSSWSSSPAEAPASSETSSSSSSGQSKGSASTPSGSQNAGMGAAASPVTTPFANNPSAATTSPAASTASPAGAAPAAPASKNAPSGTGSGNAESGDWGSDSSASSSGGW